MNNKRHSFAIYKVLPAGLSKIEKTKVRKQLKTSIFRLAANDLYKFQVGIKV